MRASQDPRRLRQAMRRYQKPLVHCETRVARSRSFALPTRVTDWPRALLQGSRASLRQRLDKIYPEGTGRRGTVLKDGGPAPLIKALYVNAKEAVDDMWKPLSSK